VCHRERQRHDESEISERGINKGNKKPEMKVVKERKICRENQAHMRMRCTQ
jgi:hypothetical protein